MKQKKELWLTQILTKKMNLNSRIDRNGGKVSLTRRNIIMYVCIYVGYDWEVFGFNGL